MVEVTGLEPAASCSQSKHSTKLSYTSKEPIWFFHYSILSAFCQVFSRRKKTTVFRTATFLLRKGTESGTGL